MNTINVIIGNRKTSSIFLDYFIDTHKNEVMEGFITFFVDVGPKLAKEILLPLDGGEMEGNY